MEKPVISNDIEMFDMDDGRIEVFNKNTKKSYIIGKKEYTILKELNGSKSYKELAENSNSYNEEMIKRLILKFEQIGFIKGKEKKEKLNILKMKKGIMSPNKVLKRNNNFIKIANFIIVYLSLPLFIFGMCISGEKILKMSRLFIDNIDFKLILFMYIASFVSITLHELSHAIVARSKKMNVAEFGIMLYWFIPCAYVNLNGIAFVKSKKDRILILMAGILSNGAIAGITMILANFVEEMLTKYLMIIAIVNISIIFSNLVIYMKFDGYYILEQFLEISKLREKSFGNLKQLILNRNKFKYSLSSFDGEVLYDPYESYMLDSQVYVIYSILSIIFIILTMISIMNIIIIVVRGLV